MRRRHLHLRNPRAPHVTSPAQNPAPSPTVICEEPLNGPVAVGAVGLVKPNRGGRWSFRIAQVDRTKKRFAIERKLLLTTLRFSFALDRPEDIEGADTDEPPLPAAPDVWTATYRVELKGALAAVYERTAARPIVRQLERLASGVAEASPPETD